MTFFTFAVLSIWLTQASQQAPDLSLKNLQGLPDSLSNHRDHVVVLNFWATWCAPCKKEMPLLAELHRAYSPRGVHFIGVSIDDETTLKHIPAFVREYGVEFPIWIGGTPEQEATFRLATAVPATVIIDRDGTSAFRIVGEVQKSILEDRLDWLLSDRSSPAPAELVLPASITAEHFRLHELGLEDEHEEEEEQEAGSEVPS